MKEIEIIKPDDWHVHFRDGEILKAVVPETTRNFARAIIMPNLIPPIINAKQAQNYKKRIESAIPPKNNFLPLMTLYLTEKTNINELQEAYTNGLIFAAKLYPAGATTNSESGVKNIQNIIKQLVDLDMGILITDHNVRETLGICDRAYVMRSGEMLATGTSDEVANDENVRKHYLGEHFTF